MNRLLACLGFVAVLPFAIAWIVAAIIRSLRRRDDDA